VLVRDEERALVVLAELAHSLGMTVVSEGVETSGQHLQLTRLGSDCCQGFYFARPMIASGIDALIEDQSDGSNPHLPLPAPTPNPRS